MACGCKKRNQEQQVQTVPLTITVNETPQTPQPTQPAPPAVEPYNGTDKEA